MRPIIFIFSIALLFLSTSLKAQQIKPEDVPQDVLLSFSFNYPDGLISSWETKMGNYVASFALSGQNAKAEFTANGKWLKTKFDVKEKELPSRIIIIFLKTYGSVDYTISLSNNIKTAEGENYYYIEVKKIGIGQPTPAQLFFDLDGILFKIYDSEEARIVEDLNKLADENKQAASNNQTDSNAVNNTAENVDPRELPSVITSYIKESYVDFSIKDCKYQTDAEFGQVYFVVLKKQGEKGQVDLYFDFNGKLLKTVNTMEIKTNQHDVVNKDQTNKQNNNQVQTNTDVPKKTDWEDFVIDQDKVPALAKTTFASKNKKATNIVWYLKDEQYIAKFLLESKKGQSTYTIDGVWTETRVAQDETSLNPNIVSLIKFEFRPFNYGDIFYVTMPKDKFFEIHMFDKRSKAVPAPDWVLYFDATGKFRSVDKPDIIDPYDQDEQQRRNAEDQEFLNMVDSDNVVIDDGNNYNDKVDPKELPTPIHTYVKKNYPQHVISACRLISDDDLGNIYYLEMKEEGKKPFISLYFDLVGKFIKKIDPEEQKIEDDFQEVDETDVEVTSTDESIDPKELPSGALEYLDINYPDYKATDAFYMTTTEYGAHYEVVMKKQGLRTLLRFYFDLNGNLIKAE